ncbi:MAG: glutathione S-transferase family protein [Proteobacteria bacterium]|nr:glutathione S-transferase family protein [Pseudomonadota bacterium]
MIVYGALLSPFVRKVCVALEEKGMAYQLATANPGGDDPAFREASPLGKIPALRDGDYTLADSTAIVVYADAKQPQPALLPAEPRARGKAMWFDEWADTVLVASGGKVLFNRLVAPKLLKLPFDEAVALQGEAELPRHWAYLEGVVPDDGWLVGDFSLADIAVASAMRSLTYVGHGPSAAYPRTLAWYNRVAARPSWQAVARAEAPVAERLRTPTGVIETA